MIVLVVIIHESQPNRVDLQLRGQTVGGGGTEQELVVANEVTDALSHLKGGITTEDTRIVRDRPPTPDLP